MIDAPELTGVTMSNLLWPSDAQMARLRPLFPSPGGVREWVRMGGETGPGLLCLGHQVDREALISSG